MVREAPHLMASRKPKEDRNEQGTRHIFPGLLPSRCCDLLSLTSPTSYNAHPVLPAIDEA